jgi:hypothetical protein
MLFAGSGHHTPAAFYLIHTDGGGLGSTNPGSED